MVVTTALDRDGSRGLDIDTDALRVIHNVCIHTLLVTANRRVVNDALCLTVTVNAMLHSTLHGLALAT